MAPVVAVPAETDRDGRGEGSAVRRSERIRRPPPELYGIRVPDELVDDVLC